MKTFIITLSLFLLTISSASSQSVSEINNSENNFKQQELRSSALQNNSQQNVQELNFQPEASGKSPGLAFVMSLVLPGAGHLYLNRMDVGKYFLGFDALNWLGLAGVNFYGNAVRDDARIFARQHAELNVDGDDDFYTNVGNFTSVYDYNNEMLSTGQYDKVYDVNSNFWLWDNISNRDHYENQREKSERMYNTTVLFATGLVINRLASAISALIIGNKQGSGSGLHINSEMTRDYNNKIDGLKLNIIKNF